MQSTLFMILLLMCLTNLTSSIGGVVKKINKKQNKKNHPTKPIQDVIYNEFKKGFITPIFNTLESSKKYYNYFNKNNANVLVSFDVKYNDKVVKNWFVADSLKELYNFIRKNPNYPLYEQISTDKHKLFFDVDINKGDEGFGSFNFPQYKTKLEKELKSALNNKKLNFIWLDSTNKNIKYSYHLIINNIYCNIDENRQLKDHLNALLNNKYLDNVYSKNRCFRLWSCSKFGEKRPLKIIDKNCCFRDTLVNIYKGDKVVKIDAKVSLQEELSYQTKFSNIGGNVPFNDYLMKNFIQNKRKPSVFNRKKKNSSLPCPICISPKDMCKEKHHKNTDVYIFKKNEQTYLGCFRAKNWMGDRYFLNLEINKVEHLPKPSIYNINENNAPIRILKILYSPVFFGKYKGKKVRELFKDSSYVSWILLTPSFDTWIIKEQLKELIKYSVTTEPQHHHNNQQEQQKQPTRTTVPTKTTQPKYPTKYEMIEKLTTKWGIDRKDIEHHSLDEIKMHFDMMLSHGCFG
jgi:hypothetical protein